MKKIIAIALFVCSIGLYAGTLNERAFTDYFIKTLNALDGDIAVKEKGWFHLEVTKGKEEGSVISYLDNAYATYKDDPEHLEEIVTRYAKNVLDMLDPKERQVNIDNLVPVIKDTGYIEEIKKLREGNLTDAFEYYNDELVIMYAEDTPERLKYLQKKDLDDHNLSYEKARKLAVFNLNRILDQKIAVERYEESFLLQADGTFETSLILADEIWKEKMIEVKGDYIVLLPARGLLLVTGSENKAGIELLKTVSKGAQKEAAYPVSPYLFRYDGKKFVRFTE